MRNVNELVYNIKTFKQAIVEHANEIKVNGDSNWESNDAIIDDAGNVEFWFHSHKGEGDHYRTSLNLKLFTDDRVIDHHLANCKTELKEKIEHDVV